MRDRQAHRTYATDRLPAPCTPVVCPSTGAATRRQHDGHFIDDAIYALNTDGVNDIDLFFNNAGHPDRLVRARR
jgi:hypothetical protein